MFNSLSHIGESRWYWLALLVLGLSMEGVALYYQHGLQQLPCLLCIHVRIWVAGFILLAVLALLVRNAWFNCSMHALATIVMAGLLERSYQLLGTERGFVFGSCEMDLAMPTWFQLDVWFPALFKVWEACGYTPELLFGITMAEALIVLSAILLAMSLTLTVVVLANLIKRRS